MSGGHFLNSSAENTPGPCGTGPMLCERKSMFGLKCVCS